MLNGFSHPIDFSIKYCSSVNLLRSKNDFSIIHLSQFKEAVANKDNTYVTLLAHFFATEGL